MCRSSVNHVTFFFRTSHYPSYFAFLSGDRCWLSYIHFTTWMWTISKWQLKNQYSGDNPPVWICVCLRLSISWTNANWVANDGNAMTFWLKLFCYVHSLHMIAMPKERNLSISGSFVNIDLACLEIWQQQMPSLVSIAKEKFNYLIK